MAKTWKKTSIKVASKDANETARNRSFNNVAENADETKIGQLQLFENKGVQLYVDPVKAEYVDTEEKVVFAAED